MNLQSTLCGILFCISVAALIIACLAFTKKGGEYYTGTPTPQCNLGCQNKARGSDAHYDAGFGERCAQQGLINGCPQNPYCCKGLTCRGARQAYENCTDTGPTGQCKGHYCQADDTACALPQTLCGASCNYDDDCEDRRTGKKGMARPSAPCPFCSTYGGEDWSGTCCADRHGKGKQCEPKHVPYEPAPQLAAPVKK